MGIKKITAALVLSLLGLAAAGAESLFQLNTRVQGNSYPLYGSSGGGKDTLVVASFGVGLKSVRGKTLGGIIDATFLLPVSYEEKIHPATSFTQKSFTSTPVGFDALLGVGFNLHAGAFGFQLGTGVHAGGLFIDDTYLLAFGLGIDAQTYIGFGKFFTVQIGVNAALDFFGTQTYVTESKEYICFPTVYGVYAGIGIALK